jgi:tetratricopeptide (TPR) repeat protein
VSCAEIAPAKSENPAATAARTAARQTALFFSKKYAEAKPEYRWLTEHQPNLAAAYYFLALTHDQLGEFADAMANYQQFLRLADKKSSEEVEKVNLRLPGLQKQLRSGKGKRSN